MVLVVKNVVEMTIWSVAPVSMTHSVQEILGFSVNLEEKTKRSKLGELKEDKHKGILAMLEEA